MKLRRPILLAIALSALALAGTALWLGSSASGLRFVLARIQAAVPGLGYSHAQGRLGGEFVIEDLRLHRPGVQISADRVSARLDPLSLLGAAYDFSALRIDGLRVQLLPATQSAAAPSVMALPRLRVAALTIHDAVLIAADGSEPARGNLSGALELYGQRIQLGQLQLQADHWQGAGRVTIDLSDPWWLDEVVFDAEAELRPGLRVKGRLQRLHKSADRNFRVRLEQPLRVMMELSPGANLQSFAATLQMPTQAAEALGLPASQPVAAALRVRGDSGALAVSGELQLADRRFAIADSRISYHSGQVQIHALALDLPSMGRVTINGSLPLSATEALTLQVHSDELQIAAGNTAPWRLGGDLALSGSWQQLALQPDFGIRRGDWPELRVSGTLALEPQALHLTPLQLRSANGRLDINGQIGRDAQPASALALELVDFDPGLLLPDWPGRLHGSAHWLGRLSTSTADGQLQIDAIEGRLRQQPVHIAGSLQFSGLRVEHADLGASIGPNSIQLRGDTAAGSALHITVSAPDLAALWPGSSGALALSLDRDRDWRIQATGTALHWQESEVAGFSVQGHAPIALAQGEASLHGRLTGLRQGKFAIDSADFDLDGRVDRHRIKLALRQPDSRFNLAAEGGWSDAGWGGLLTAAELQLDQRAMLRLAAPSALQYGAGRLSLGAACVEAPPDGRACLSIEHDAAASSGALTLERMPIDWLAALVPTAERPRLRGRIDGEASLSWQQGVLAQASAELRADSIALSAPGRDELALGLHDLVASLAFRDGHGRASLRSALAPEGRIRAGLDLLATETGALKVDGDIELALADLAMLEILIPDFAHPQGRLAGQLHLSGPWRRPDWQGSLTLSDFDAELPRLGLHLQRGQLVVTGQADQFHLAGSVRSGQGILHLDGQYQPGATTALTVRVHGDGVELANTSSINLVATPELSLQHDRNGWRWQGRIEVPSANIDAERLAPVNAQSADVVVIDDPPADATEFGNWRADLEFVLGDQVKIKGYGFDGKLGGRLQVSQRRGRAAVASGQLEVSGDYRAYGQKLRIERGRMAYAGSGLDEPSLDLRAERKVSATTVGIHITGTARQPQSQVYSNPALSESEALALLVTGRPLNQVSSRDQSRLSSAALALGSVGGDMLARNIGLDELRLGSDDTLQGDAFAVGKFLSPRLYIGYAVALLTRGEVFTVRYLISKHIDIEAHASERNRLLLNYRIER